MSCDCICTLTNKSCIVYCLPATNCLGVSFIRSANLQLFCPLGILLPEEVKSIQIANLSTCKLFCHQLLAWFWYQCMQHASGYCIAKSHSCMCIYTEDIIPLHLISLFRRRLDIQNFWLRIECNVFEFPASNTTLQYVREIFEYMHVSLGSRFGFIIDSSQAVSG